MEPHYISACMAAGSILVATTALAGSGEAGMSVVQDARSVDYQNIPEEQAYRQLLPGNRIIAEALYSAQAVRSFKAAASATSENAPAAVDERCAAIHPVPSWSRAEIVSAWQRHKDWSLIFTKMKSVCALQAESLEGVLGRYYRPVSQKFSNPDANGIKNKPCPTARYKGM